MSLAAALKTHLKTMELTEADWRTALPVLAADSVALVAKSSAS